MVLQEQARTREGNKIMHRAKTEKLWKALCSNGLYDTVLVDGRDNVYVASRYVIHRVESAPALPMNVHRCDMGAAGSKDLDKLLETSRRNYSNLTNFYDPELLSLALRPHKVLGSTVMLLCGRGKQPPLIIKSTTADGDRAICITTAIIGKRV